ncbi:trace amine-associated receptor 13c [Biomphalaria pfeifferi]|uniref:Trace amine-associated receptor 13c n=1 Tax=Biomphalaria pfeifferi TaxID=112525 RepID=A0AAD8F9N8_BIOPF|nr:trace amine-associated receptor 13c [Biomphalaria pfeifferi]
MDTVNQTVCDNVSVDLSESSVRFTTHPEILLVIAVAMSLVAAFIVVSNVLLIAAFVYSRYHGKYINRTDRPGGYSDTKNILSISFSLAHFVIGGFCMPLAIVQILLNGRWSLGSSLCTARVFAEVLSEIIIIYHAICMCIDNVIMVRKPFLYRMMTSKTGYVMAVLSWTMPTILFFISSALGWNTQGLEDALLCLRERHVCVAIMSKNFVFLIMPSAVSISIVGFIGLAAIVLKEVHRLHETKVKQGNIKKANREKIVGHDCRTTNKSYKIRSEGSESLNEAIKSGSNIKSIAQLIESERSISTITLTRVRIAYLSCEVDQSTAIMMQTRSRVTALPAKTAANRKRKTFGILITLVLLHVLYLTAFMVVSALLVFHAKMFPLWLISAIIMLRYFHSASIPMVLFQYKPTRKLVRSLLIAIKIIKSN